MTSVKTCVSIFVAQLLFQRKQKKFLSEKLCTAAPTGSDGGRAGSVFADSVAATTAVPAAAAAAAVAAGSVGCNSKP